MFVMRERLYARPVHKRKFGRCLVDFKYWICGGDSYCDIFRYATANSCRYQWPRGLRRRSAVARLLRLWVRIPPGAWMFVCCEFCVLSGRGFCEELITRPEESYRLWCVVLCDLETSRMRRPWPALGRSATRKKIYQQLVTFIRPICAAAAEELLRPVHRRTTYNSILFVIWM